VPGKPSAFGVLRAYLGERATFSEDDFAVVRRAFIDKRLGVGEFLQRGGDITTHAAFIASGCLRNYVIDAKGKEHIVQFAPETWWLADSNSLQNGTPSQYFIDAIEDSELLLIDAPSHQRLVDNVAAYGAAFRSGLQKHSAAKDQRIVSALSATAEERYLQFLATYPSIVRRVPQTMLAAYLGITPETLSRIRKSLSRR
jgi:CRP/FNR family transcriptional regulator, anaerobic regulatory protein